MPETLQTQQTTRFQSYSFSFVILAISLFFITPIFFVSHPDKSRMTPSKIVALLVIGTLLECTPGYV